MPTPDTPTQDTPKTANQDENGVSGVGTSRDVSGCDGNIIISKSKVKEISKGKDISFTVRNGVTRGQEPRMPVSPTVDEPVKDESVKEINMIAPPIDEKHYSADDRQFYDDCVEDGDFENADSILDFTLRTIDETDNPITRNALRKYLKDIGEEKFKLAAFRFDTDLTIEKEKIGSTDAEDAPPDSLMATPGKHLIARLKRLKAALDVLENGRRTG